jgi:Flp pilus assembly protein TadG
MSLFTRRRPAHGAAVVEFALIMVPLLTLMFGLIQYGLYFWAMQGGSDIARSAARLAAVGTPAACSDFKAAVVAQINQLDGTGSTAIIQRTYTEQNPGTVTIGDTVNVVVKFNSVNLHFPFIPFINNGQVIATAQARVDYVPAQPETCS